jgi:thiol-disulfide isomerase/thioredoxin
MSFSKEQETPTQTEVMKNVFLELDTNEFKKLRSELNNETIVLKFGAEWCQPCRKIKPLCEEWFAKLPSNVIIFDLDIDESLDLYMTLKKYKMTNGVPTILAYHTRPKESDKWYIPDDSISGGDLNGVDKFFARVAARSIPQSP